MSCPALACPSAIRVNRSLSPFEVIRSKVRLTFSFSAQVLHKSRRTLPAPGTQWSQTPIDSAPAAWAPCTNGAARLAAAKAGVASAALFNSVRRVSEIVIR